MNNSTRHILNPVFLFSLVVLIINDYWLKWEFHNVITGKLSDLAGLIVFVQLFNFLVKDRWRIHLYSLTIVLFILWKSPLSNGFINAWSRLLFPITRVVDFSDLLCLLVLIPVFFYHPVAIKKTLVNRIAMGSVFMLASFSIMSTSKSTRWMAWRIDRDQIYIHEFVDLPISESKFFYYLEQDGINYRSDSIMEVDAELYEKFILYNIPLGKDTIYSMDIGIRPGKNHTRVFLQKMRISTDSVTMYFTKYKDFRKWEKEYEKLGKKYFSSLPKRKATPVIRYPFLTRINYLKADTINEYFEIQLQNISDSTVVFIYNPVEFDPLSQKPQKIGGIFSETDSFYIGLLYNIDHLEMSTGKFIKSKQRLKFKIQWPLKYHYWRKSLTFMYDYPDKKGNYSVDEFRSVTLEF